MTRPPGGGARFLRYAIALVLLATAVGKALNLSGFAGILATYRAFPEGGLLPLAVAVTLAELALAVWLFSGRRLRAAALAALGLHLTYALWAAATLLRGIPVGNCGCFGVFLPRPLTWQTVVEDLFLAGACLLLLTSTASRAPAQTSNVERPT